MRAPAVLHLAMAVVATSAAARTDSYDFIIVGGGAAGLVVASRLSETRTVSVLVLEAGESHIGDVTVECPGCFGTLYGNSSYDWDYDNEPQRELNGRVHRNIAGKGLGGGTAVNFMFWTPNSQRNVANWGALGNTAWSWDAFQRYLKKAESFIPVRRGSKAEDDLQTGYVDRAVHGRDGPTVNSFPAVYGPLMQAWPRAYATLGAGVNGDPRGGIAGGGYTNPFNIDPNATARSYPANTYLQTALRRRPTNIRVETGAFVTKLLLDDTKTAKEPRATGVVYEQSGRSFVASARREVILSAGSMQSSKLLELAGIGNATLLDRLGIHCIVDNPHVGENFQNHLQLPLGFRVRAGIATGDDLAANNGALFVAAKAQYAANRTGPLSTVNGSSALLTLAQLNASLADLAPSLDVDNANSTSQGDRRQLALLKAGLTSDHLVQTIGIAAGIMPWFYNDSSRVFASPGDGGNYLSIIAIQQHPFSRGSVHVQSRDPRVQARLDPGYLTHPFDLALHRLMTRHVLQLVRTPPLRDVLVTGGDGEVEMQPGYPTARELLDGGDEAIDAFVRKYLLIAYHHSGNNAMMPRESGGVVDEKLKVYGVRGLRVVDASVLPMIPQGTITSTILGLAEQAADFVKEDHGLHTDKPSNMFASGFISYHKSAMVYG